MEEVICKEWSGPNSTDNFSNSWKQMLASHQAEYPIFSVKEGNKVRASKTRNGKSRNVAGYNPEMWDFSEDSAAAHTTLENKSIG